MDLLIDKTADVSSLSPLTLAFVGDTVFDLLTRSELVCEANRPVNALHTMASKKVCAAAQAEGMRKILPILTEDETAVFKRGRNARTGGIPKHASSADYHYATGLEALFGWLYLKGEADRIKELYTLINTDGEISL
ncbi:MAG: ribonuclease III domain-containing protein [Acutalibacteraceae bacterium]|nr:ribonuclease III domain-containing protein [Acutalibacteraceae bacterium]